jgi:ATP/ADP translocase
MKIFRRVGFFSLGAFVSLLFSLLLASDHRTIAIIFIVSVFVIGAIWIARDPEMAQ